MEVGQLNQSVKDLHSNIAPASNVGEVVSSGKYVFQDIKYWHTSTLNVCYPFIAVGRNLVYVLCGRAELGFTFVVVGWKLTLRLQGSGRSWPYIWTGWAELGLTYTYHGWADCLALRRVGRNLAVRFIGSGGIWQGRAEFGLLFRRLGRQLALRCGLYVL